MYPINVTTIMFVRESFQQYFWTLSRQKKQLVDETKSPISNPMFSVFSQGFSLKTDLYIPSHETTWCFRIKEKEKKNGIRILHAFLL